MRVFKRYINLYIIVVRSSLSLVHVSETKVKELLYDWQFTAN
jgi:hypothetical protein